MTYTVEQVRAAFDYDPSTGVFRWKQHKCSNRVGQVAGCLHKPTGYWFLCLNEQKIKGHIAAWIITYGVHPKVPIDHKDLDKSNNRISNLRLSSMSNNGANRPKMKRNTSGFKGVFWKKDSRFWLAQIRVRNRTIYLGIYKDKMEAVRAYDEAAVKYFGAHARPNLVEAA